MKKGHAIHRNLTKFVFHIHIPRFTKVLSTGNSGHVSCHCFMLYGITQTNNYIMKCFLTLASGKQQNAEWLDCVILD